MRTLVQQNKLISWDTDEACCTASKALQTLDVSKNWRISVLLSDKCTARACTAVYSNRHEQQMTNC